MYVAGSGEPASRARVGSPFRCLGGCICWLCCSLCWAPAGLGSPLVHAFGLPFFSPRLLLSPLHFSDFPFFFLHPLPLARAFVWFQALGVLGTGAFLLYYSLASFSVFNPPPPLSAAFVWFRWAPALCCFVLVFCLLWAFVCCPWFVLLFVSGLVCHEPWNFSVGLFLCCRGWQSACNWYHSQSSHCIGSSVRLRVGTTTPDHQDGCGRQKTPSAPSHKGDRQMAFSRPWQPS